MEGKPEPDSPVQGGLLPSCQEPGSVPSNRSRAGVGRGSWGPHISASLGVGDGTEAGSVAMETEGSSWESRGAGTGLRRWPESAPSPGAGGTATGSAPPALGPARQVHPPWKEKRRRGGLGEAAPSTAVQSRTRAAIMAASARPGPAQGAQGSAGFGRERGALSRPGLCPGIWKRRSSSEGQGRGQGEGGRLGGAPGIRLQPPGRRLGAHSTSESSLPGGCPARPQSQAHHARHTLGATPHWQAPAPPRHPPQ